MWRGLGKLVLTLGSLLVVAGSAVAAPESRQPPALQLTADEAATLPLNELSARLLGSLGAVVVDADRPEPGKPYFELTLFTAPRSVGQSVCMTDAIVMAFNDGRQITPGGLRWIKSAARFEMGVFTPRPDPRYPAMLYGSTQCDGSAGMADRYFAAPDATTALWLAGAREVYSQALAGDGPLSFDYACEDPLNDPQTCQRGRRLVAAAPLAHAGIREVECDSPVGVRRPEHCLRVWFADSEEMCAGAWEMEISGGDPRRRGVPMDVERLKIIRRLPCWSHTTRLP